MDGIHAEDCKAARGLQMLGGKDEARGRGRERDPRKANARSLNAGGLELGRRRQITVVQPGSRGSSSGPGTAAKQCSKGGRNQGQTQAVRVVDHGETQKEAVRRLFDAEVVLRSYEEELESKSWLLEDYRMVLKARGIVFQDPSELKEAAAVAARQIGAISERPQSGIHERGPGLSECDMAQLRRHKDLLAEKAAQTEADGGDPEEVDYLTREIPFWLRNDEQSRAYVEGLRQCLMKQYCDQGHLDNATAIEHLWQCGLDFALRWGGSLADDLVKQNETMDMKNRKITREALKESSMLRQHIKRLERKYQELLEEAKKMHKQLRQADGHQKPAHGHRRGSTAAQRRASFAASHEGDEPEDSNALAHAHAMASDIVDGWMKGGGTSRQGDGAALTEPDGGGASGTGPGMSPGRHGKGTAATGAWQTALRDSDGTGQSGGAEHSRMQSSCWGGMPYADLARFESFPLEIKPPSRELDQDETLGFDLDKAELEQMDHEIFEPLNMFDEDMKQLLIDCVDEKVRRILTLDPSKFQNGKLPFGIRPHGIAVGVDELDRLRDLLRSKEEEVADLKTERGNLKAKLAALDGRMSIIQTNIQHSGRSPTESPSHGRGRVSLAVCDFEMSEGEVASKEVQTSVPSSPVANSASAPRPNSNLISPEELSKRIAQATKDMKTRIEELEAQLRAFQREREELESKNKKLPARAETEDMQFKPREAPTRPEAELQVPRQPRITQEPLAEEHLATVKALRRTQDLLRRVLTLVSLAARLDSSKGKSGVEALIGPDGSAEANLEAHINAVSPFEVWTKEALNRMDSKLMPRRESIPAAVLQPPGGAEPEPLPEPGPQPEPELRNSPTLQPQRSPSLKPVTPLPPSAPAESKRESREGKPEPGDSEEVLMLRKRCKAQKDEISRLLMLIDELRKRIEDMAGPGAIEAHMSPLMQAMDRVGLRQVAEARTAPRLKGVFERLYSDACQRITRYSLIRERVLAANALCGQVIAALSQKNAEDGGDIIPDFESLNATASAALSEMFYQTDYLFRSTCEYAITQGVENTLYRVQRTPLHDFTENLASEDTEQFPDFEEAPRRSCQRLPGRRSERPRGKFGGRAVAPGSLAAAKESRKGGGHPLAELEPASFGQYVEALRDAHLEEQWLRSSGERLSQKKPVSGDPSTLKAAILTEKSGRDTGRQSSKAGLFASQSLPALPKGRSLFQSESPAATLTSKAFMTMAA